MSEARAMRFRGRRSWDLADVFAVGAAIARRDATNDERRHRASLPVAPVRISPADPFQGDRNACNPSVSALNGISAAPSEKLVAFAVAPGECISA